MNLHVALAPEVENRLRARAAEQGLTPEAYVAELLDDTLSTGGSPSLSGAGSDADEAAEGPHAMPADDEDEDSAAPWRGVFVTDHQHETLFTQDLPIAFSELPRREPNVIINPRWHDDED